MLNKTLTIQNKLGLHARAAAKFVNHAGKFQSEVWITKDKKRVNGKSIMGVMMLAARQDSAVQLEINGPDEQAAMEALEALINDKFGEGQ